MEEHLNQQLKELEADLVRNITEAIFKELATTHNTLQEHILKPYTSLVRSNKERIVAIRGQLTALNDRIATLRTAIDHLQ